VERVEQRRLIRIGADHVRKRPAQRRSRTYGEDRPPQPRLERLRVERLGIRPAPRIARRCGVDERVESPPRPPQLELVGGVAQHVPARRPDPSAARDHVAPARVRGHQAQAELGDQRAGAGVVGADPARAEVEAPLAVRHALGAPADPSARFEHHDAASGRPHALGRDQAGDAGADHHHVGRALHGAARYAPPPYAHGPTEARLTTAGCGLILGAVGYAFH
jgi:hypothetical protein